MIYESKVNPRTGLVTATLSVSVMCDSCFGQKRMRLFSVEPKTEMTDGEMLTFLNKYAILWYKRTARDYARRGFMVVVEESGAVRVFCPKCWEQVKNDF